MDNTIAGKDRYGHIWKVGYAYANNGANEVLILLTKVIAIETGKSYFDHNNIGYLHCRTLTEEELKKLPRASYKQGKKPKIMVKPVEPVLVTRKRKLDVPINVSEHRKVLYKIINILETKEELEESKHVFVNANGVVFGCVPEPVLVETMQGYIAGAGTYALGVIDPPSNYKECHYKIEEILDLFEKALDVVVG